MKQVVTKLRKMKSYKVLSSAFLDHNDTKLDINYKRKLANSQIYGNWNNILLNNHWLKEELFKNQEITWDKWKWKQNIAKLTRYSKSSSKREVYSDKHLHEERTSWTTIVVSWGLRNKLRSTGGGNGNPFQYSCLNNTRTEEPGRL